MSQRVVCRVPECPDSIERNLNPPALQLVKETERAWTFKCLRCEKDGRISFRAVDKTQIGGTIGAGVNDRGYGTTISKGPGRYRAGFTSS